MVYRKGILTRELEPGDWRILRIDRSKNYVFEDAKLVDEATHVFVRLPDGTPGELPLTGKATQPNGDSWEWDGNFEAPTLVPSIDASPKWHGWLTNGKFVKAGAE